MLKLSEEQVNSWRLSKHHLVRRENRQKIAEVVSDVCGIQAQVLSAAELAIRARVEGITQQDVRRALWKDGSIVKTWCMRGTLHLLATEDLPMYVAALKTKLSEAQEWLEKTQGVRLSELEAITAEIKTVLYDRPVTRDDLVRQIESRVTLSNACRKALRSAWGILLRPAALQGMLAFGPNIGPKSTFFRPDSLTRNWKEPATTEAFSELFRRFARSYGPITIGEFAHWWGNLRGEEKSILEADHDDFIEVQVGRQKARMLKRDAEEASGLSAVHGVRLLPSFDCYVMFYSPREAFVPRAHRSKIFRQTAGWNSPTLVVDGFAAGTWSLGKRTRKIEVNLELFRKLDVNEKRHVQEDAADIGEFYGLPVEVRYMPSC